MVRLGRAPTDSRPEDLSAAVRAAHGYGQRPAITVLRPSGRQEQGFASLLQWMSKGAHWLETDHDAASGGRLLLAAPAGWAPAAVALAAWWAGLAVTDRASGAVVGVVHEDREAPTGPEAVLAVGDAFDGRPTAATGIPAYMEEVQLFPDDPPAPRAAPDTPAVELDGASWTQRELIAAAGSWDVDGPIGLGTDATSRLWLPAVVVRPLLTGHATVVLDGVDRRAAAGDRIARWVDDGEDDGGDDGGEPGTGGAVRPG